MASQIPSTMRAVALDKHCEPSEYALATLPVPTITRPDELLIRVHASSINPIDVKLAGSLGKLMGNSQFPYKIGYDLAGEVVAVGTGVTAFKPGDKVYSRAPTECRGSVAQYCLSVESATSIKPSNLEYAEASSIPLAAMTALQALDIAEKRLPGGLKGKTVYVAGGLSGTGGFAVQLAKHVFGAGKVISTLSTQKIPLAKQYLGEGTIDQMVDYRTEDVITAIGKGTVDFMFDTQKESISKLSLMKKGGMIVSISTVPNGSKFKRETPTIPSYLVVMLNVIDWFYNRMVSWKGVGYEYLLMEGTRTDLERLKRWVEEGKVRPVVGEKVKLEDIRGVRAACQKVYVGKGGVGKLVIEVV